MVIDGLVAFVPASLPAFAPGQSTITKANNTIAPDRPESWVEGVVPGSLDIALWDATVTGPNTTTMTSKAMCGSPPDHGRSVHSRLRETS
jgi:hypothetical protein